MIPYEKRKRLYIKAGIFLLGMIAGTALFHDIRPRSILAIRHCENCLALNEITGLAGALAVTTAPEFLPNIVLETDKSIAIEHPSGTINHYVILPKRDIKNLGDMREGDEAYVADMFAVTNELIRTKKFKDYRVWSNGPGTQGVAYLHIHLQGYE